MSKTIYLTVPDAAAWQTLSITAWPDGIPKAVSVDGPFPIVETPAEIAQDGTVITEAIFKPYLGVNLRGPAGSFPPEISDHTIEVQTPERKWAG